MMQRVVVHMISSNCGLDELVNLCLSVTIVSASNIMASKRWLSSAIFTLSNFSISRDMSDKIVTHQKGNTLKGLKPYDD